MTSLSEWQELNTIVLSLLTRPRSAHPQTHPVLPELDSLADHLWRLCDKSPHLVQQFPHWPNVSTRQAQDAVWTLAMGH